MYEDVDGQVLEEVRVLKYLGNLIKGKLIKLSRWELIQAIAVIVVQNIF